MTLTLSPMANSLLLEVTSGCSHNKCSFCVMYENDKFKMAPIEQIKADIKEASRLYPHAQRVFLTGADPFVLSAKRLTQIAQLIHENLPNVGTIAMYARIQNIASKSDSELKELRKLGINELNIGLESAEPSVLARLNKGFSVDEARAQLNRLSRANIDFSLNIIIGAGGREMREQNALANAKFISQTKPYLVFIATMHLNNNSPLAKQARAGEFSQNSLGENIDEEMTLVANIRSQCLFYGLHTSNAVPLAGMLPAKQLSILQGLENGKQRLKEYLNIVPERGKEGANILSA